MADLPAWVILSLRETMSAEEFVKRAGLLGVSASVTRDGIHLGDGFLAEVRPKSFPGLLIDRSVTEKDLQLGPATLEISGGTNQVERELHQQPEAIRKIGRDMAKVTQPPGLDAIIESNASRKMLRLTKLVHALTPLATLVVLPKANHLGFEAEEFKHLADEYVGGGAYTFPLWTYLKVREDHDATTIESTGLWTFGLPDVAMASPPGAPSKEAVLAIGALQREMVAEGVWPEDGSTFASKQGSIHIDRVWDGLWIRFANTPWTPGEAAAKARFVRRRQMALLLGDHTLHHRNSADDEVSIEHFLRADGKSIALTNGLSDKPQPGGRAEEENLYIELSLTSAELGPWANAWLDWSSQYISGHDETRAIRPRDRLVLPDPMRNIAGAIVWPTGHLAPEKKDQRTVVLWDLVPFFTEELAKFRLVPTAQAEWMEQRVQRNDIPDVLRRWSAVR